MYVENVRVNACHSRLEIVKYLVENGADVKKQTLYRKKDRFDFMCSYEK